MDVLNIYSQRIKEVRNNRLHLVDLKPIPLHRSYLSLHTFQGALLVTQGIDICDWVGIFIVADNRYFA